MYERTKTTRRRLRWARQRATSTTTARQKCKKKSYYIGFCVNFAIWRKIFHIISSSNCSLFAIAAQHIYSKVIVDWHSLVRTSTIFRWFCLGRAFEFCYFDLGFWWPSLFNFNSKSVRFYVPFRRVYYIDGVYFESNWVDYDCVAKSYTQNSELRQLFSFRFVVFFLAFYFFCFLLYLIFFAHNFCCPS